MDALIRLGRECLFEKKEGSTSLTLTQLAEMHEAHEKAVEKRLSAAVSSENYLLAADLQSDSYECKRRSLAAAHASRHGATTCPGLDILAIGPLTNLALAARLDHSFPATVRSLFIMGGTSKSQGNVPRHPAAEFNCYADPEAAAIVLSSFTRPVLLTNECCVDQLLPWKEVDSWREGDSRKARFLRKIAAFSRKVCPCLLLLIANTVSPEQIAD